MLRSVPAALGIILLFALTGCTKRPPEFSANDQVPAEQRTAPEGVQSGGQAPPATAAGVWVVEGADLAFDQAPQTLPAGRVTITLDNKSGQPHNVAFDGVQGGQPIVDTQGRDSDTGTVTLKAGTYTFFCTVPGHRPAGMEGKLTVQ
jgi:plastocyanin